MIWAIRKFRHSMVRVPFEINTDHYSRQWLCTMKAVECAFLHWWRSELEEFKFVVKYHPGKFQIHVDALSQMPVDDMEHICAVVDLLNDVQNELREIKRATHQGQLVHLGLVSLEGYSFDKQGSIGMGPLDHLMEVLHRTAGNHMGTARWPRR